MQRCSTESVLIHNEQQFLGAFSLHTLKPWRIELFIKSHAWRPEQLMMRVTLLATTNLTASFDCASIFLVFSSKTRTKRIQKVWIAAVKRTETVYCVLISHRGIPRHHGKARKSHDCHCRSDTQTENRSIYLTWHTSSSQTSTQKKQAQEAKLHPLTLQTIKSFKLIHLKQTCYRFFGLRVFDSKSCAASSSPTKSLELLNRKVPKAPKMQQVPAL